MGEAISACAARLREKAKECEFGDTFFEGIIQTIDNKKLIDRAISKTWDLSQDSSLKQARPKILPPNTRYGNGTGRPGRVQSVPAISGPQHQMKPWKCGFCVLIGAHVKGRLPRIWKEV